MSSARCETFASVILSSVGVSLHLFKARLLPTDGVLCDIPRRLCVPLATAQSRLPCIFVAGFSVFAARSTGLLRRVGLSL